MTTFPVRAANRAILPVLCRDPILRLWDKHVLHSRDLAEWCRRSPNHYIRWGEEDFGNGKIIADLKAL